MAEGEVHEHLVNIGYKEFFDNSFDIIVITDLNGRIIEVNKSFERVFGIPREKVRGRYFADVLGLDAETASNVFRAYNKAFRRREDLTGLVFEVKTESGIRVLLEGNIKLLEENGRIVGFVGTYRDITEKALLERNREELLEKLVKSIEAISYVIDRVRNPLAAIRAYTEMLVQSDDVKQKILSQVDRITSTIREMDKLWAETERIVESSSKDSLAFILHADSSAHFWKYITDNMLTAVFVADESGRQIYVNDIFAEATKYSKDELLRMKCWDLTHEDSINQAIEAFEKAINGEKVLGEYKYVRKDGAVRHVYGVFKGVTLAGKKYIIGNYTDITGIRKLEKKLRESEKFYRTLLDVSVAPVVYIQDGVITYVNNAFEEIAEYKKEEVIGKNPFDLIHPDDVNLVMEKYMNLLSGASEVEEADFRILSKSGKMIWARVRGSIATVSGKPALVITGIDITGLKESERFHRELMESFAAPFVILKDGKFLYVNRTFERTLGYTRDGVVGRPFTEILHPGDRGPILSEYLAAKSGKKEPESSYTLRVITKDGKVLWMTVTAKWIDYWGERATLVTGIDITEVVKLSEELNKANEFLRLLSKMLRHDVLNDLTVVRAHCEIAGLDKALKRLDEAAKRIKTVRNLEEALGELKPLNVKKVVEEVVEKYRDEAVFSLNLQDVEAMANDALFSVVDNIIGNAILHAGVSPVQISVYVFRNGRHCVIRIADNGVGIPDENKEKIFEYGYSTRGGGLGLFITKRVVELLGGEIRVYDNTPTGAVFEIKLNAV